MEYLFIYLLQLAEKLDILLSFLSGASILLIVAYVVFCFAKASSDDESFEKICNLIKPYTIAVLASTLLLMLIPTKQTLLLMGGLYLGKQTSQKLELNSKIDKVNTIISLELDKRIKELSKGAN